tara:strand:- start:419 stop:580 length:162 start_codon:yes stop_codon:yes gene_type:complete
MISYRHKNLIKPIYLSQPTSNVTDEKTAFEGTYSVIIGQLSNKQPTQQKGEPL